MAKSFSADEAQTRDIARKLGEELCQGSFIALTGELGAGKTVFTKGIAAGLGVREEITSPTFTVLCAYESGRLPLYHFDAYRITDEAQLDDIDFEDYAYGDGVCVCEWAENIRGALPEKRIDVHIAYAENGQREITVRYPGALGAE